MTDAQLHHDSGHDRLEGYQDNNSRSARSRVVHADPTFTQGPNCVVCIDDLNAKLLRPYVNPNLKYHFLRTTKGKTDEIINVGSYGTTDFYVCASVAANCTRVALQDAFDGRKAFSDFVLFVYEAMSQSGGGGAGSARSSGGSFVYSVR